MRLLAVDLSGVFSQMWESTQGKELSEAFTRTIDAVARHREGFDRVAVAVDSGPSFRRAIWPEYKTNRIDRGPAYREQLRRTAERLGLDGCTVFWAPKVQTEKGELFGEADDVIGTLCAWATKEDHYVRVLSADKDLLQLVVDGAVEVCKPDGQIFDAKRTWEAIGVLPEKVPLLLALMGDKSDNYKAYDGVGKERAVGLIKAFAPQIEQGISDVFAHIEDAAQIVTSSVAERMKQAGPEPGRRALQVATIRCDLPINFSQLLAEPVVQELASESDLPTPVDLSPPSVSPPTPPPPDAEKVETARPRRSKESALVRREPGAPIDRYELQPHSIEDLYRVAKAMHSSRMYGLKSEYAIMAAAIEAQERGKPIGMALRNAYDVHGKLAWSASWLAGLVLESPVCEYAEVVEADDLHCVIEYKKRGRPVRTYEFTIQDAQRAGLVRSNQVNGRETCKWISNPKSMCTWACWRQMARERFPEVVSGMYTPDELRDGQLTDAEFLDLDRAAA